MLRERRLKRKAAIYITPLIYSGKKKSRDRNQIGDCQGLEAEVDLLQKKHSFRCRYALHPDCGYTTAYVHHDLSNHEFQESKLVC